MNWSEKDLLETFKRKGIRFADEFSKKELKLIDSLVQQNKIRPQYGSWSGLAAWVLVKKICSCCQQTMPHA